MNCVLLKLRLNDGVGGSNAFCITSAPYDIVYDGDTFTATGDLLNIEELEEGSELTTRGLTITLNGVDPAYQAELQGNGFTRAPIDVLLATVPEGDNVPSSVSFFHRGYCDSPLTEVDYENGQMMVQVETTSIFTDLDRIPDLMRCSMASHQSRHPGDKFFEFTSDVDLEEIWKVPD